MMSPSGSHVLAGRAGGDLVVRHKRIRDAIFNIAKGAALAPVKEKYGLLSDCTMNRPADVFKPSLNDANNVCLDIAVTCPIKGTFKLNREECNKFAEEIKMKRYHEQFKGVNKTYILP